MPTPRPEKETREEWIRRCVPQVMADGTTDNQDQAVAICFSMWRQAEKSKENK
jgi:hypothetical protein